MKIQKIVALRWRIIQAYNQRKLMSEPYNITVNGKYIGKMTAREFINSEHCSSGNINQGIWKLYGVKGDDATPKD